MKRGRGGRPPKEVSSERVKKHKDSPDSSPTKMGRKRKSEQTSKDKKYAASSRRQNRYDTELGTPSPSSSNSRCKDEFPIKMDLAKGVYEVPLQRMAPFMMCSICSGYLIDACTVVDCCHTFCKSCLLKYFDDGENTDCPQCASMIHQSHPTQYVSMDRTMQEIIYKMIPGLKRMERKERLEFIKQEKISKGEEVDDNEEERQRQERLLEKERNTNTCFKGNPVRSHHRADAQVVVQLLPGQQGFPRPLRPVIRLSQMATINTIKRYLAMSMWKKVSRYNEIDLFCNNELMGRDFSMRFIQLTRCRDQPKTKPLRLYYKKHIEY